MSELRDAPAGGGGKARLGVRTFADGRLSLEVTIRDLTAFAGAVIARA